LAVRREAGPLPSRKEPDPPMSSNISTRRVNARKLGAEDYERKRRAIIEAAAGIFKERGYDAASVEEIARAAGMDRASIYYYYSGKQDLFREMVAGAVTDNVLMAERIVAGAQSPPQKLRDLIAGLFASYERHFPYLFIYVQEDMARVASGRNAWSTEMRSLNRRFDKAVVTILRDGLDDGSLRAAGDERLLAAALIGMCNWSHRWYEPGKGYDRDAIVQAFSDMVLNGLTARRDTAPP
jgi:TetR/AcrR family transcriptional regulator, cholesterol catabolism regulator